MKPMVGGWLGPSLLIFLLSLFSGKGMEDVMMAVMATTGKERRSEGETDISLSQGSKISRGKIWWLSTGSSATASVKGF